LGGTDKYRSNTFLSNTNTPPHNPSAILLFASRQLLLQGMPFFFFLLSFALSMGALILFSFSFSLLSMPESCCVCKWACFGFGCGSSNFNKIQERIRFIGKASRLIDLRKKFKEWIV
jgi:hypothetical protein